MWGGETGRERGKWGEERVLVYSKSYEKDLEFRMM